MLSGSRVNLAICSHSAACFRNSSVGCIGRSPAGSAIQPEDRLESSIRPTSKLRNYPQIREATGGDAGGRLAGSVGGTGRNQLGGPSCGPVHEPSGLASIVTGGFGSWD